MPVNEVCPYISYLEEVIIFLYLLLVTKKFNQVGLIFRYYKL